MSTGEVLSQRAISGFPLSIGTGLAFETLFEPIQTVQDPERLSPPRLDLASLDTMWINISTLFRNLVSALPTGEFAKVDIYDLVATLESEMEVIQSLFAQASEGCVPVFYYSTYDTLFAFEKKQSVKALRLRHATTDSQLYYQATWDKVLKVLEQRSDTLRHFKDALVPDRYEQAVVLTHQPYDLTKFNKFARLDLLESHTGIVKPRYQWNTKYHSVGTESLQMLPFHRRLLLIFGDRVLIRPTPMPFRMKLLNISNERKWNSLTTLEKVDLDAQISFQDPFMAAIWNSLKTL